VVVIATRTEETRESVVSADGTPIAVWRSGEGTPLVLVHGTAADHSRWAPVLPALAAQFTVLSVDRRGRGGSGDAADYALEREFEDVTAVIEWAGTNVNLLGHSYGAVCSLEAALLTSRLRRLILYEPPLGFLVSSPDVVTRLQELLAAGDRDELVAYFLREIAGLPPEQVELMRSMPTWQARIAAADTIPREESANRQYAFNPARFRALQVPTLFLLGGESPEPFKAAADAVQATLPDCRTVVMPGQRHAAMDTATDLFLKEVTRFLEEA
jgi:pimeloyl-ACP methyl ester carboxylesterase